MSECVETFEVSTKELMTAWVRQEFPIEAGNMYWTPILSTKRTGGWIFGGTELYVDGFTVKVSTTKS